MTNLSWLLAIIKPRDVAAHLNFRDEKFDRTPSASLAAIALGDGMRLARAVDGLDDEEGLGRIDAALPVARRLLDDESQRSAIRQMRSILSEPPIDYARHTALTIFTVCAAAELDDFDLCLELIASAEGALPLDLSCQPLRAALLIQRSLRLRDSGNPYWDDAVQAHKLLTDLDVGQLPSFGMSPGVGWDSKRSLQDARDLLMSAARSHIPDTPLLEMRRDLGIPDRFEEVRQGQPNAVKDVMSDRLHLYRRELEGEFERVMHSESRYVFGRSEPDFYFTSLAFELSGHALALSARQELAMHRLVRSSARAKDASVADSLRLLRQARANKELGLALAQIRENGPLDALSRDARQIIENRLRRPRLGEPELRVLEASAELLTEFEASRALDATLSVIGQGGVPTMPGGWRADALQIEPAFLAATALAQVCDRLAEAVSSILNWSAKMTTEDQLWNRSIMRALNSINWASADDASILSLESAIRVHSSLPTEMLDLATSVSKDRAIASLAAAVHDRVGSTESVPRSDLERVVDWLYPEYRAGGMSTQEMNEAEAAEILSQSVLELREGAARGTFSYGGIDTADLAAAAICDAGLSKVWPTLAGLLIDSRVVPDKKRLGFERLSRSKPSMPDEVREMFISQGLLLLEPSLDDFPWQSEPSSPVDPAALRFMLTYDLIDDLAGIDLIVELLGSQRTQTRHEGAKTLEVCTSRRTSADLAALAMQASFDQDVRVRASSGRALLNLCGNPALADICGRRLTALLQGDGLLIPIRILRASRSAVGLPAHIRGRIERVIKQHPSSLVRKLALDPGPGESEL